MALVKQSYNINFSKGLDTKTDPYQVQLGNFLNLENAIFDKGGALQKRNGFAALPSLPDTSSNYTTTHNGNLLALGNALQAYDASTMTWINKSSFMSTKLDALALHRSNTNQSYVDLAIAANDLMCVVFTDNVVSGLTTIPKYYYTIMSRATGQSVVAPVELTAFSGTVSGSPKVVQLGNYFVIVTPVLNGGIYHLEYQAVSIITPSTVVGPALFVGPYVPSSTGAFDIVVSNNILYLAWYSGAAVKMIRMDTSLALSNIVQYVGEVVTHMSIAADESGATSIIYVSYYDSVSQIAKTLAVGYSLLPVLSPTTTNSGVSIANLTSIAQNQLCTLYFEYNNNYGYDAGIPTHYIRSRSISQLGALGSLSTLVRSVGLASKAFLIDSAPYFLSIYNSAYQPTAFLINGTNGKVVSILAYSNANSYLTLGLPNVVIRDKQANIPYLIKNQVQSVNKEQGAVNTAGIYSQIGINLAAFTFDSDITTSSEIGGTLNLPSGFLWGYDGSSLVENGFFLWPDYVEGTPVGSGGSMTAQQYYYQVTYEWSDSNGNIIRSAPSIPISVTTTVPSSSVTLNIPTLRLTYKTNNPVKIVVYRWSVAQQTYYQTTSVSVPLINDPTVDYITFTDTNADSSILGNTILYTTGGVVENIGAPACDTMVLFQSRLFIVKSEDKNLLWFSKQVIENTPVEMSDLLTIYVAPTLSAQGDTGYIRALSAMDDKLIIFKKNAIYYITGQGPDNTGANNGYSDPVFITGVVGSVNQRSIVLTPDGLLFQSDKGIWLLGRDLSTTYLGAPVQQYTQDALVKSALTVPGTNQVRFTMDSGVTLMYDYYYKQWGTFTNIPAVASTLYNSLHTYINASGEAYQESIGQYLDGTNPVLIKFTTSWINVAGLQGYQRAYFFYLLNTHLSPHKLALSIAYDYNSSPSQALVISPTNYDSAWGGRQLWGSSPQWGGPGNLEQWRVFLNQQKCQSFQISVSEIFDASLTPVAGAGFTMSGINLVIGSKSSYNKVRANQSTS